MKKKIYFVQPNTLLGNSIYYPYAVGVLASYALQFEEIYNDYELAGIVFKEEPAELIPDLIENPAVVGFSNYFWNYQYNLQAAEILKKKNPDCTIIFGGHQITKDSDYLEKYPFIDILIFSEGEIPFAEILKSLSAGGSLYDIPNIFFRDEGRVVKTPYKEVGADYYPSPYTSGIFDKLLNVPENMEFNAQLETNRGCPYHCSFCDWCSYDLPVRKYPMERVKSDLEWISSHKIAYCMCVDSNFGIFERDEEIARFAVELKKKTGYPDKFGACFAKNKTDRIFRINKMLNDSEMSKGVSLSFQSMSEEVLRNISRSNMNKDKLSEQLRLYHEAGIPTYTELILGLPGETLESFSRGICELLERGQHDAINVFRCEVYPNSTLADRDYIKKFGIKTAVNHLNVNHSAISNAVFAGGMEYIIETSTMTREDLVKATVFSSLIQGIHCRGPLRFISIYLYYAAGVSYYDFYNEFISFFENSSGMIGSTIKKISGSIRATAEGKTDTGYINPVFGSITWPYDEAMLCDYIFNLGEFFEEADEFFNRFNIDSEIKDELIDYQKNTLVTPGENDVTADYKHNWKEFFDSVFAGDSQALKEEESTYRFHAENVPDDWENYAKIIIWYGRRNMKTIRKVERVHRR